MADVKDGVTYQQQGEKKAIKCYCSSEFVSDPRQKCRSQLISKV